MWAAGFGKIYKIQCYPLEKYNLPSLNPPSTAVFKLDQLGHHFCTSKDNQTN